MCTINFCSPCFIIVDTSVFSLEAAVNSVASSLHGIDCPENADLKSEQVLKNWPPWSIHHLSPPTTLALYIFYKCSRMFRNVQECSTIFTTSSHISNSITAIQHICALILRYYTNVATCVLGPESPFAIESVAGLSVAERQCQGRQCRQAIVKQRPKGTEYEVKLQNRQLKARQHENEVT